MLGRNLKGNTQEWLHLAGQKCEVEELVLCQSVKIRIMEIVLPAFVVMCQVRILLKMSKDCNYEGLV